MIEKVTCLITRPGHQGEEILLFEHPFAGNQIPAGTVEPGELIDHAVIREAQEETGLSNYQIKQYLGYDDEKVPEGYFRIQERTSVYARPDRESFDWAYFRRGIMVELLRKQDGFSQVRLDEMDNALEPQYVSYSILGWVPDEVLGDSQRRHFYLLETSDVTSERWSAKTDNHTFSPFWAPMSALPPIIFPQSKWLRFLDFRKLGAGL